LKRSEERSVITVHHLGISQSDRIVWLCEELEIPYELKLYSRTAAGGGPPEYKALHPFGTAPVIKDGDLVLGESAAIIEYLVSKYGHGRLIPKPGHPHFVDYLYWFHFANGSMMPSMMVELAVNMMGGTEGRRKMREFLSRSDTAFDVVNRRLAAATYFAGSEFTAADIMMLFPLTTMRLFTPRELTPYPNIVTYLQRIGERPGYRRACQKADPNLTPTLT
jgi:glutathione S-transferase